MGEPGGTPPPQAEKIGRRAFLSRTKDAVVGVAATAILAGCAVRYTDRAGGTRTEDSALNPEQLRQMYEKVWGGLTEVLEEGQFSRDSLSVSMYEPGQNDVVIHGTLTGNKPTGNNPQVGIDFSIDFSDQPDPNGERLELNSASGELVLGELRTQDIKMKYLMEHNAGDVQEARFAKGYLIAHDSDGMRKRFKDVEAIIKGHLKLSPESEMIPGQDYNGIYGFDQARSGYGQLIQADRIDEKDVTINI